MSDCNCDRCHKKNKCKQCKCYKCYQKCKSKEYESDCYHDKHKSKECDCSKCTKHKPKECDCTKCKKEKYIYVCTCEEVLDCDKEEDSCRKLIIDNEKCKNSNENIIIINITPHKKESS